MRDALEVKRNAYRRRLRVLDMVYAASSGHIGGDMSCIDALSVLFDRVLDTGAMLARRRDADRLILSKGHCAEALYVLLADYGFLPAEALNTFAQFGTRLAEHPTHGLPGVDIATGALGHGLCVACGMALGYKRQKYGGRIYALMGDGEQDEGSVWEAAMFAAKYRLDNLTALVDRNGLQISGATERVMPLGDLGARYQAFGWTALSVNGHDYAAVFHALTQPRDGRPVLIVLNTVKGKGSSVMENQADWHHLIPTAEQYARIRADLIKEMEA